MGNKYLFIILYLYFAYFMKLLQVEIISVVKLDFVLVTEATELCKGSKFGKMTRLLKCHHILPLFWHNQHCKLG